MGSDVYPLPQEVGSIAEHAQFLGPNAPSPGVTHSPITARHTVSWRWATRFGTLRAGIRAAPATSTDLNRLLGACRSK